MNIKELRKERSDKAAKGKSLNSQYNALGAKASRTEEEDTRLEAMSVELDTLAGDIEALDAQIADEERKAKRSTLFQAASVPALSTARTVNEPGPGRGGFRNLAEMAVAVRSAVTGGSTDPRLAALNSLEMGAAPTNYEQNQGSAGEGFLVPPDYRKEIWELVFQTNDLLQMFTPVPTNSNFISIPKDETTPWGASGVQAAWRSEAAQLTASKIAMGQTTVQLHELISFVIATGELLDDAPMLQDKLTRQAARAISWKASDALMWGDGNGKPLGFMNAGALVTVNKESGQAAGTIAVANVLKMMSRLFRTGGGAPFWIGNPDILPQLGALTIGNNAAWLPVSQALVGSPWEGTLCGRPIIFSEHAQSLSTAGDLTLINTDGYLLANKAGGGIDYATSIHLFFDYNMQAFRWITRMGGQPYLSAPVSPANGSNTKSHFIALQGR